MKTLILLLLFSTSGCATTAPLPRTKDVQTVKITWVRTTETTTISNICKGKSIGCTVTISENECIIYAPEPPAVISTETYVLGHEVLHCFLGHFHK